MTTLARQIVALSKPRVVMLLVFTGVCGVYAAAGGQPDAAPLIAVIVAGTLSASGANAINQGLDADIDAVMSRTRKRPVPSHQLGPWLAILIGAVFVAAAVLLMYALTNGVAAALMFAAAATYVFVYTVLLKRRSWNNIVIGGAAGAFPPLIGAAGVTGDIDAMGLYMFAFIFFWTPPHFAVVTTAISVEWLRRTRVLFGDPSRAQMLSAYKFSLLYLAIAFLVLAVEPLLPWS
jgi:protoheme IX farnesyltransferase